MWLRLQPRIATKPPSACSSARATRQATAGNRSGRAPLLVSSRSGSASGRGSDSRPDPMAGPPPDLLRHIPSRSKVSEVLSRRRPLSLQMIRSLHAGLRIPADVLLQRPRLRKARAAA